MTVSAGDRLRRMLAMVPWIVAHPGVEISRVSERFDVSEKDLLSDLDVIFLVGLPPYSPDSLVDVVIDDGRVWINYADFFSRPLRLTPAQGLALVAASDALLSMPGTDPSGPLARALQKLEAALGLEDEDIVEVDLGRAEAAHLDILRRAVDAGTEVVIDYYSYGRDDRSRRRIAPYRVAASGGAWYVEAWCHKADGERLFRVDRIGGIEETGEPARLPVDVVHAHGAEAGGGGVVVFQPSDDDPRVRIRLAPAARWVVDTYPCEAVIESDDGGVEATLVVTAAAWFERLVLVLGPDLTVLDDTQLPSAGSAGAAAASRILARYRS